MELKDLNVLETESVNMLEGTAILTENEVIGAAAAIGRVSDDISTMIRRAISDTLIADNKIPRMHEVMACVTYLEPGTQLRNWHFTVMSRNRFA